MGQPAKRLDHLYGMSETAARTGPTRPSDPVIQAGKLAAIGELAAGVVHEINNPLFAILGHVEFALRDAQPGSATAERMQIIQRTGLEIKELVRSLLQFARGGSDEFRSLAVRDVCADAIRLLRLISAGRDVEIVERYLGTPTPVWASPDQLKQIVLALLLNAQQAMPEGGTVTVEVEPRGANVHMRMADTGPGIEDEAFDRIFEPFYTTKRSGTGTGLGLAVCRGIAEAHGATLTADNRPEGGAEFELVLPALSETAAA
jgi:two-component system, NtrC family, sensor kinase